MLHVKFILIIGIRMITLQELCAHLDHLLQPQSFKDYCYNGLQFEGKPEVLKIATGVSASLATIQAAAESGADALIVHHGLFWNQDSPQIYGSKKEKLQILFNHNLSLIAYHLPLDAHQVLGNNWKAAEEMGWQDLEPFAPINGLYIGVCGRVNKMHRLKFQKKLEDFYEHHAHVAFGGKEEIETVGLVSGGSYKMISEAVDRKLDCFIAGNFDEPVWNQAFEEKINFYALGHSATERVGPRALGEYLSKEYGIEHQFIDIYNPF